MKILITITNPTNNVGYDIQIDNKQKISTTLKVCSENLAGLEFADRCKKIRLWDGGRLIPVENMSGDDNNFEYERDKFIQRIIQYRQYKEIASHLQSKQEERKQMHVKTTDDIEQFEPDNLVLENLPEKIDVNKLSKAIQDAIDKYKMSIIIQRKILVQELSVQDIEAELWAFLVNHSSKTISFSEYLSCIDSMKISQQFVVTTFLAILDLVRYSKITISQKNNDSEIYINVIGE